VARWAIGDLQGCCTEFEQLLREINFNDDRDQLWLTGDLVNRGPQSLAVLRLVRVMGANLVTVLGNHDLHLLALALTPQRRPRRGDTLDEILQAPDRETLIGWLLQQPLACHDAARGDLLVHAGLVPQWSAVQATALAREVQNALLHDPVAVLSHMYGDEPASWDESLTGTERLRFIINVLTRLRACTAGGRIDLKQKGPPDSFSMPWLPWFDVPGRVSRDTRVIFGHWSALGLLVRARLLGLDTGCVWGGELTAVNLDDPEAPRVSIPSLQPTSRE
jgi:bis(5'-nucleosyl)-tetraphosphatase (symmetrical)